MNLIAQSRGEAFSLAFACVWYTGLLCHCAESWLAIEAAQEYTNHTRKFRVSLAKPKFTAAREVSMYKQANVIVILAALTLVSAPFSFGQPFTVVLTRFGGCANLADCIVEIPDNSARDRNPAPEIIDFSVPIIGEPPDGVFSASGVATQTVTQNAAGTVTGISMQLTNSTVEGLSGGTGSPPVIGGQVLLESGVPLASLNGVSGFASLAGQYENFSSGTISNAGLTLQARLGGVLLGLVDPGMVSNVPSPVPFAGFDARQFPCPVDNLLFGIFNFDVAANDGFVLPGSGDVAANAIPQPGICPVNAIPEPGTMLLLSVGLIAGIILKGRTLQRKLK